MEGGGYAVIRTLSAPTNFNANLDGRDQMWLGRNGVGWRPMIGLSAERENATGQVNCTAAVPVRPDQSYQRHTPTGCCSLSLYTSRSTTNQGFRGSPCGVASNCRPLQKAARGAVGRYIDTPRNVAFHRVWSDLTDVYAGCMQS